MSSRRPIGSTGKGGGVSVMGRALRRRYGGEEARGGGDEGDMQDLWRTEGEEVGAG
jgi:hypothetical protein